MNDKVFITYENSPRTNVTGVYANKELAEKEKDEYGYLDYISTFEVKGLEELSKVDKSIKESLLGFSDCKSVKIKNGEDRVEPAIFIVDKHDIIHLCTITPDHKFCLTNEGPVNWRYTKDGKWVGDYRKIAIMKTDSKVEWKPEFNSVRLVDIASIDFDANTINVIPYIDGKLFDKEIQMPWDFFTENFILDYFAEARRQK